VQWRKKNCGESMTYAESCARWIEKRREQGWEWDGVTDTPFDVMVYSVWGTPISFLKAHPSLTRALYDAIVRERGK